MVPVSGLSSYLYQSRGTDPHHFFKELFTLRDVTIVKKSIRSSIGRDILIDTNQFATKIPAFAKNDRAC